MKPNQLVILVTPNGAVAAVNRLVRVPGTALQQWQLLPLSPLVGASPN